MARLIDADALKETIASNVYPVADAFNSRDYGMFWTGGIEKAIDEQPTIEERKTGKWIPCRECLPEKAGKYLVTVQNGNVYAGTYDKYSGRFQCAATAWMELPAPYQEDD